MARVLVPLAPGCEELEAVTVIDILRRAEIEVVTAGLRDGPVRASRRTVLVPDTTLDAVAGEVFDMVVLPGGLPGADHLAEDHRIRKILIDAVAGGRHVAAICAAPKVLAAAGLLDGKSATCYPGTLGDGSPGSLGNGSPGIPSVGAPIRIKTDPVVVDGSIVTSRGPGTAMDFALELVSILAGPEVRNTVEAALQRP